MDESEGKEKIEETCTAKIVNFKNDKKYFNVELWMIWGL